MQQTPTKTCRTCAAALPATEAYFPRDRSHVNNGGLRDDCRGCRNEVQRQRRAAEKAPPPEPARTVGGSRVRCDVLLFDVHAEERDRPAWCALLAALPDIRPDVLHLVGDFGEFVSVSQHGGAKTITQLEQDFATVRQVLRDCHDAASKPRIIYAEGNHETRLERYLLDHAPSLADSLSVRAGLRLDELGAQWIPEGAQPYTVGSLDVAHGHQLAAGGGGLPKHHAAKAADLWGQPGRTVVFGHTHRYGAHSRPTARGTADAVGIGCLRTLAPGWTRGKPSGWCHQFAVAFTDDSGRSDLFPITIRGGRLLWGGRVYGG